ncbi:radical SAM protein HxsC4 [Sandaracinus amylolyticus]|nr:radical SAM protein HxsC4 [Sandaracinus amylolyticus]
MTKAVLSSPSSRAEAEHTSIDERIAHKDERVHVLTGAVCNNNCVFCMEEDRDARYVTNSQTDDALVRFILEQKKGAEEICFTSGEPTTNPRLPHWVRWAKEAGIRRVSVMTNGRSLSYEKYARMLISAGMNRFYVSIHGHTQKLHDGLTRTPESFDQTVAGLDVITKYKRYGVELHTSTVITKRNLPHMGEIYRFLRAHGVDQVVFNVMQANGRANTYFEHIFPTYTEIAETARVFLEEQTKTEPRVMAFLVDIPLCTTTKLPDFNRGYVESYVHYEPAANAEKLVPAEALLGRREALADQSETRELVAIRRADLDDSERQKRAECAQCKHEKSCEGVWGNYLKRYGWDEFVPVA